MPSAGGPPQISILDARLEEIDRRLSTIQSGLNREPAVAEALAPAAPPSRGSTTWRPPSRRPEPAPRPAAPAGEPSPPAPEATSAETIARLQELTRAQESIIASLQELLSVFERLAIPAATSAGASASGAGPVSVSAGPLASTQALRGLQRSLESLPGVRSVEVRGFEGEDRAILDVHLS